MELYEVGVLGSGRAKHKEGNHGGSDRHFISE
jgi:hypothetical protein